MAPTNNWIWRSTECAQAWRQPRWRLQLLAAPDSWVHARLPGIVPAAVAVTTLFTSSVSAAAARLPAGHGA